MKNKNGRGKHGIGESEKRRMGGKSVWWQCVLASGNERDPDEFGRNAGGWKFIELRAFLALILTVGRGVISVE
jgi:hypothetical protein